MSMTTAAVLGTGAWGTTFAQVLADAGVSVTMWGRNADTISFINGGENPTYLPGIALSERISATTDTAEAVAGRELVVVAVPVKAVRATLSAARESFAPDVALLSLAKGLELGSLKRVDEIIAEASGVPTDRIAVLSGIGDLVATCSSRLSRNFSLGHRLGSGMGLAEALALSPGVVEGVASASPILQVAASVGVDMPITGAVVEVVEGRASIEDMGRMLLARPQKMDGWKIELV